MGGEKRTFGYGYGSQEQCPSSTGNDFNRTGGSRDGIDYVTCYDGRGRLAWTTDPHLVGEDGKAKATWDGLGRLVGLDGAVPLALTWEAGTQASGVTQGDVASTMLSVGGVMIREDVGGVIRTLGYSGPDARLPSLVMDDAQKVTGMLVGLPGGAIAHLDPAGALERIDHPDLFLGVLASTDANGAAPGLAAQYGPYGEPLVPATTASMEYGWQATPRNPTLSGFHDLTFTARPYHPWLGAFLAFDPDVGVSPSGYGYGDGNPLDNPDPSGMSGALDIVALVFGIVATISGAASGVVARSSNGEFWETELKIIMVGSATISGALAIARQIPAFREQAPQDGVTVASAVFAVLGVVAASVGSYRYSGQVEVGIKARQAIEEALERSTYSAAKDLAEDSLDAGKKAVRDDEYNRVKNFLENFD
jgi:RHS repeat-associated protein